MNKKKKLDQNTIQTAKRLLKYMTGTHKIQFIIEKSDETPCFFRPLILFFSK